MVYEGGVEVINDDGTAFTFDDAEGVAWLQMYVDMVAAGTVDKDRRSPRPTTGSRCGSSRRPVAVLPDRPAAHPRGQVQQPRPCTRTSPSCRPRRQVRRDRQDLMAMSVKADTKFPNASIALAQFFTNPQSMVEFTKLVAVYPSAAAAYDDPFFTEAPEPSRTAPGRSPRTSSRPSRHHADDPEEGRRQRDRPQGGRGGAVQQRPGTAGPDRRRRGGQRAHQ